MLKIAGGIIMAVAVIGVFGLGVNRAWVKAPIGWPLIIMALIAAGFIVVNA